MAKTQHKDSMDDRARRLGTRISKENQNDGWINVFSGLGKGGFDRRTGGSPGRTIPLREYDVEEIYTADNMARRLVELLPFECFRRFIEFTNLDPKIQKATIQHFGRLQVVARFQRAHEWARLYGGSGIYVSVDDGRDMSEPLDLTKVRSVKGLIVLHRWELWSQYTDLETNINDPNFGYPRQYYLQPRRGLPFTVEEVGEPQTGMTPIPARGRQEANSPTKPTQVLFNYPIHSSRIIRFDGKSLPVRKRASNNYWEDSVYTAILEVLRDYQTAHGYLANIIGDFSMAVHKIKDLKAILSADDGTALQKRMAAIALGRSVLGTIPIDMDEESFEYVERTITGIPDAIDRLAKRFQAYTDTPHTILFNESPSGLGASGNHEEKNWHNIVASVQRIYHNPHVDRLLEILWCSKTGPTSGKIPDDYGYEWLPLSEPTDLEKAQAREAVATADNIWEQMGVLTPRIIAENRFAGDHFSMEIKLPPGYLNSLEKKPSTARPDPNAEPDNGDAPGDVENNPSGGGRGKGGSRGTKDWAIFDAKENVYTLDEIQFAIDLLFRRPGQIRKSSLNDAEREAVLNCFQFLDHKDRPVQTVMISKDLAKTEADARKVMKKFGVDSTGTTATETPISWRFREVEDVAIDPKTFKTFNPVKGVAIVYGHPKD